MPDQNDDLLVGWDSIRALCDHVCKATIRKWADLGDMPLRYSPTNKPMISRKELLDWYRKRPKKRR